MSRVCPVPISSVKINDSFWSPKLDLWRRITLTDVFDKFEQEGAFENFDRVASGQSGGHKGMPWYDGLIYETIRAASDFLASQRDGALEERIDSLVGRISRAAAADPNGYVNTFTTLMCPHQRWGLDGGNPIWQHDLYNAGALIEAAVHYYQATQKIDLLKVATVLANYICGTIGPSPKMNIVPEHALPEESFIELYRLYINVTSLCERVGVPVNAEDYLRMTEFWIEARGNYEGRQSFGAYSQDHMPILEQPTIEGHAVRATLMAAGLTAAAYENQRADYFGAAQRLWDNMVHKKMHITGGVGAFADDEKFGADYELPNDAYLETCAAVSAGFFHRNMHMLTGKATYIDELERALFNGVLPGVSLDGRSYFYVNPLEAGPSHQRWDWHSCPCCPPMFLKMVAAIPGYIYTTDSKGVYINLFVSSRASLSCQDTPIGVTVDTEYPWGGELKVKLDPEKPVKMCLRIRQPEWCSKATYQINGESIKPRIESGYAVIERLWLANDEIKVQFDLTPHFVHANPNVAATRGLRAIQYGPVVYCLESADNGDIKSLWVPAESDLRSAYEPGLLGGVMKIEADAYRAKVQEKSEKLYQKCKPIGDFEKTTATAIPYYANANRQPGDMAVWIPSSPDLVRGP